MAAITSNNSFDCKLWMVISWLQAMFGNSVAVMDIDYKTGDAVILGDNQELLHTFQKVLERVLMTLQFDYLAYLANKKEDNNG